MGVKLEVSVEPDITEMSVDELLDALGISGDSADQNDITVLRHVRPIAQRRAAAMIADHTPCAGFHRFKPLFERVECDLKTGMRKTTRFGGNTSVAAGDFFIVGGQLAYVAEVGGLLKSPTGESDARLRVIYANGTESNLLRRSLQRALYKDSKGRRISSPV